MIVMQEDKKETNEFEVTSPLLTAEDVATLLNINVDKIWAMLRNKQLPGIRIGREWRIEQNALNEYIRKGRNMPK